MDTLIDEELRANPEIRESYGDLLDLYPNHPIEMDRGVVRWKKNPLACWLIDAGGVSLNQMAIAFQKRIPAFPLEDYTHFYRDIGYSLCGFIEIFGEALNLYEEDSDG